MYDTGDAVINNSILRSGGNEIQYPFGATVTVNDSNVEGGWPGVGNVDADPLFVDADGADDILGTLDDNLRLSPGSPCIDAGDNAEVDACGTDLDGNPRFMDDPMTADTGSGNAPIVDMGAYEFAGTVQDCNSNGIHDACEIEQVPESDCNENLILDECEPGYEDCNDNGVADLCDVADGSSYDCNEDLIPDYCQRVLSRIGRHFGMARRAGR